VIGKKGVPEGSVHFRLIVFEAFEVARTLVGGHNILTGEVGLDRGPSTFDALMAETLNDKGSKV